MKKILNKKIIGIVGTENSGKTNTLFNFIEYVKSEYKTRVFCYFYHQEYKNIVKGVEFVTNLEDLEQIKNSFIFIDEFSELFQLSNRHFKQQVERVFNMLHHNNNIVVLCGVPSYYKQFIASRVKCWVLKTIKYKNCVNGSSLKEYLNDLTGDFVGATRIQIPINKMLVDGVFFKSAYFKKYDKKSNNVDLFERRGNRSKKVFNTEASGGQDDE